MPWSRLGQCSATGRSALDRPLGRRVAATRAAASIASVTDHRPGPAAAAPLSAQALGIVLVLVSAAGFGSGALFVQPLYDAGMEPLAVLFWRFTTAALFSWGFLLLSSRRRALAACPAAPAGRSCCSCWARSTWATATPSSPRCRWSRSRWPRSSPTSTRPSWRSWPRASCAASKAAGPGSPWASPSSASPSPWAASRTASCRRCGAWRWPSPTLSSTPPGSSSRRGSRASARAASGAAGAGERGIDIPPGDADVATDLAERRTPPLRRR